MAANLPLYVIGSIYLAKADICKSLQNVSYKIYYMKCKFYKCAFQNWVRYEFESHRYETYGTWIQPF